LNDLVSMREILNDKFVQGFLSMTDNVKFESLKKQVNLFFDLGWQNASF